MESGIKSGGIWKIKKKKQLKEQNNCCVNDGHSMEVSVRIWQDQDKKKVSICYTA